MDMFAHPVMLLYHHSYMHLLMYGRRAHMDASTDWGSEWGEEGEHVFCGRVLYKEICRSIKSTSK